MTAQEDFHRTDPTGLLTLQRFARASQFNRWLFESITPYCRGEVLEIGSGIGNMSAFFLESGFYLTVSDLRVEYCEELKRKFGSHPQLEAVESLDLLHPDFSGAYAHLLVRFDTVVALNVIEHIEEDIRAVTNIKGLLKPGGCFVMLVPAGRALYNGLDRELGHHRRYSRSAMAKLFTTAGLRVAKVFYFNAAGIAGWVLNGSLRRKKVVPAIQLDIFNRLVPLFRLLDKITARRLGLSIIGIGKKI